MNLKRIFTEHTLTTLSHTFISFILLIYTYKVWAVISTLPPWYDKDNARYIKFCASSKWVPVKGGAGVPTGHTIVYLKGACLDLIPNKLPKLRLCRPQELDLTSPESGVGISTDGSFKNIVFSAIPGLTPFISGGLSNSEKLTNERKKEIIAEYTERGYFDGIELTTAWFNDKKTTSEYLALESAIKDAKTDEELKAAYKKRAAYLGDWMFGTEYALNLSRYLFCINIPVNENILQKVVNHLNNLNDSLATSKGTPWRGTTKPSNDYLWHAIYNNCDHTGHNTVAATGAICPIPTDLPLAQQLFHLAVPGQSLIDICNSTIFNPINVNAIYSNSAQRLAIMQDNWPFIQHDTLVENIPFHRPNDLFVDTSGQGPGGNPLMAVSTIPTILAKYSSYLSTPEFMSKCWASIPYLSKISLPDCLSKLTPFNGANALGCWLDLAARKAMSLGKNPICSYQLSDQGVTKHYKYFIKKYEEGLEQITSITSNSNFTNMKKLLTEENIKKLAAWKQSVPKNNNITDSSSINYMTSNSSSAAVSTSSISSSTISTSSISSIRESSSNIDNLSKNAQLLNIPKELADIQSALDYVSFIEKFEKMLRMQLADAVKKLQRYRIN